MLSNANNNHEQSSNLDKTIGKYETIHHINTSEISASINQHNFKIILLGDICVGKTSILNRFVGDSFKSVYHCTISVEFKVKSIQINSDTIADLNLWDTCGEERYNAITRQYYRDANGVLLIFDLTKHNTLSKAKSWLEDIRNSLGEDIVIFLVGNKLDLVSEGNSINEKGKRFAEENRLDYIEVSAKTGKNVVPLFEMITKKMISCSNDKSRTQPSDDHRCKRNVAYSTKSVSLISSKHKKIEKKKENKEGCC